MGSCYTDRQYPDVINPASTGSDLRTDEEMKRFRLYIGKRAACLFVFLCLALVFMAGSAWSQEYTSVERAQVQEMLRDVANDIKNHYYDPSLHGLDWNAQVRETEEKIARAKTLNAALAEIATLLDSLNDSHTYILPPLRPYVLDYGFHVQMIGDRCYVVHVRPGSDAEARGLRSGDEVVSIDGYTPARVDYWKMHYLFWMLQPQMSLRLEIRKPSGIETGVDVEAKVRQLRPLREFTKAKFDIIREEEAQADSLRPRFAEIGNDLLIVKIPKFLPPPSHFDSVIRRMRNQSAVILDLRGNPGGSEEALTSLLGALFENKITIGEKIGRGTIKPFETQPQRHPFTGRLAVVIDSESGSASEILARVVQIQKRGLVIGDRSSGKVMEALRYGHMVGSKGSFTLFEDYVTDADIRMTDGQSLEGKGVIPDELILPDASDLENSRDPVLAKAAELLNVKMNAEQAGELFPYEWPKD